MKISHPDKLIFPNDQLTKEDLVNYYQKIATVMLPHIKNRPITMHRFPDGIKEQGFYMKNVPGYFPDWMDTISITKKSGGKMNYVMCNSKAPLAYIANQGCVTPHIWLSQKNNIEKPDKMIFDLDPPNQQYHQIKKAALALRHHLENQGLIPFLMSTGSSGCHVVVPIKAEFSFDQVRKLATRISKAVVEQSLKDFTLEQRKDKRENKVFIDILRNVYGQTSVAPYALRAIPSAPVATPLSWNEFKENSFHPQKYTIKNIFKRLGQMDDPWKGFNQHRRSIKELIE